MNSFILNNKMAIQANSIPHFSGKKELSLQDLDTLAKVVHAHGMTTEYVPAGMPRGRRQYTGANYNLSQFVDECNGETAAPDKPGTLASVQYRSTAAPYIDNGNMVLPLAHDYAPAEDSSEPAEQATGGICAISVPEGLKRPQIKRGDIQLPLAHSDWGEAEGAMCTPGLVYGVELHDDCDGAIASPYIEQGVIHLPAGMGAECTCKPATYTQQHGSCMGLIRSVDYVAGLSAADICDGNIRLPLCTTRGDCPGVVGGIASVLVDSTVFTPSVQNGVISLPAGLQGLQTVNGQRTWAELACAGIVRLHDGDASSHGVSAQIIGGYLNIYVDRT